MTLIDLTDILFINFKDIDDSTLAFIDTLQIITDYFFLSHPKTLIIFIFISLQHYPGTVSITNKSGLLSIGQEHIN